MNGNNPGWSTRRRLIVIVAALIVLAGGAVTAAVVLTRPTGNQAGAPPTTTLPAFIPVTTAPSTPTASSTAVPAGYLLLWPFTDPAAAAAWQTAYRGDGHQPWHLDAGQTALSFTRDYLGYTNVDTVVGVTPAGSMAWVSVGFANPNGKSTTAAVLHLVRIGSGTDAPWEVVGSRDTTLTLTAPAYGATVRTPVTAGGLITGVDETLRVQVHSLTGTTPLGQGQGVPTGGDRTPWRVTVPFSSSAPGVLTIAVAAGGHIADVERFAITAVVG